MRKSLIVISVPMLMLGNCTAMLNSVVTKSLDNMDIDRDGKVSKQEFIEQIKKEGGNESEAGQDFDKMDANNDGYLVAEEFTNM